MAIAVDPPTAGQEEPKTYTGIINFNVHRDRLGYDADVHLNYTKGADWPNEAHPVQLRDVRADLSSGESVMEQVHRRGWAVCKHESAYVSRLGEDGGLASQKYLKEATDLMQSFLECSRVIMWNSTVRHGIIKPLIDVPLQPGPEEDFDPMTRIQPPAPAAHVDQDEASPKVKEAEEQQLTLQPQGRRVVRMSTGEDPASFKRSMIINLWRPLKGPVTNYPLCMIDFSSFDLADTHSGATQYGTSVRVFHNPKQEWYYVRHQMPDEVVVVKCYDSWQGEDGGALYAPHVAADMDDGILGVEQVPRESVEVRCVAIWD